MFIIAVNTVCRPINGINRYAIDPHKLPDARKCFKRFFVYQYSKCRDYDERVPLLHTLL